MQAEALQHLSSAAAVDLPTWLLAVAPIALLVGLVASSRVKTTPAAVVTLALALVLGWSAFGATSEGLVVALAKGLWTGVWILGVVWTALLLHAACRRMGMDRLGGPLTSILGRPTENVLVAAWVFPSFVQGVAGFGTPIAVSAPLLVSMGVRPVLAVALPLVGYHWAVGFGSVGSSFYMGALTARLTGDELDRYAATASLLLGVNVVVSGVLVALMYAGRRGLREGWRLIALAGPAMAGVQALTVRLEPGVGALAGGGAGVLVVAVLALRNRRRRAASSPFSAPLSVGGPGTPHVDDVTPASYRRLGLVMLPYALLLLGVLGVLLPPPSRAWAKSYLAWGPSFSATRTSQGVVTPAVTDYQPIAAFGHPGSFILLATLASILVWWSLRRWPRRGVRELLPGWFASARKASYSVLLLASVATVMADAGMVRAVAVGVAQATGKAFPALAGVLGALGSFTTGSTTSSNALFAALQADVARLIDVHPSDLVAAQLAGGNVGNSLAPVVMLMGAAAVGARDRVGAVFRAVLLPAVVLLLVVVLGTVAVVTAS